MSEQTPVAIISGAASGMGLATAKLLADAGYTVEGCDTVASDSSRRSMFATAKPSSGGSTRWWRDMARSTPW